MGGGVCWRVILVDGGSFILKIHRGDKKVPAGERVVKVNFDSERVGYAVPYSLAVEDLAREIIARARSRTPKRVLDKHGPQVMARVYLDGVPVRRTRTGHFVEAEEGRNLAFFGLEELIKLLTGPDAMSGARMLGEALKRVAEEEGLL